MSSIRRSLGGRSILTAIAWSLAALDLLLVTVTAAVLLPSTRSLEPALALADVPVVAFPLILAGVGAIAVQQRPTHRLAWVFLVLATGSAVSWFVDRYAAHGLIVDPESLPVPWLAAWLASATSQSTVYLLWTFPLLLYPDGRLPSPAWRPVAWGSALAILAVMLWGAFGRPTHETLPWTNPFALPMPGPARDVVEFLLGASWFLVAPASIASVALRFRRSRGAQRQQLKWFFYSVAFLLATFLVWALLEGLGSPLASAATAVAPFALLAVAVAVGIAVLRHQLLDIDLLINRTLVYAALTVVLGAAYITSILVLQGLLSPLTGESALAVAASTLAAAALFQPVRRRIQAAVDRRFYRSRYDAARIVEAFTAQLRQDVDLDHLSEDLRLVAEQTMRPTQAVVWLRERRA